MYNETHHAWPMVGLLKINRMITKTYELVGKDNCMLRTVYCGTRVSMEFKGGNFINGKNALLRTSNPFVQDAIEHDSRFGSSIRLVSSFESGNDTAAPVKGGSAPVSKKAKEVRSVKNVNDAIDYLAKMGYKVESDEMLGELMEKLNVSFPNMR